MSDVVLLSIHRLPDDPPTGDLERGVLLLYTGGHAETTTARVLATRFAGPWIAWAELPVLPERLEDRLTTEDVAMAANACENEAHEMAALGSPGGQEHWLCRARCLRLALGEEA